MINPLAAVSVANFTLQAGNWTQNTVNLPLFSASNSFSVYSIDEVTLTISGGRFARFVGGDGSGANPYQIVDIYGLQGIGSSADLRSSSYVLNNDIDASSTATWNMGSGFVPIGSEVDLFSGDFDGNNQVISNLFINLPGLEGVGLFGGVDGSINGSIISDLGLVDSSITGFSNVGGIIGLMGNAAQIIRSFNTGDVFGEFSVGGIVGAIENGGTLNQIYNSGDVTVGVSVGGGLIGNLFSGPVTVRDALNVGSVSGGATNGGIVGSIEHLGAALTLKNVLNTGLVIGEVAVGGLIAIAAGTTLTDTFWDTATSGQSMATSTGTPAGATGGCFTGIACANGGTVKLSAQATYPQGVNQWDFVTIWGIIENISYPFLRAFNPTIPPTPQEGGGLPDITNFTGFITNDNAQQQIAAMLCRAFFGKESCEAPQLTPEDIISIDPSLLSESGP